MARQADPFRVECRGPRVRETLCAQGPERCSDCLQRTCTTCKSGNSPRSLQGNAVPPQPVVHRPDVASEHRRHIFGASVLLEVQVPKAPLGEDVTVFDSARSHLRPRLMQPLVDRGDPHVESLRDFANRGTPVVQAFDDLAREGQSVTVQFPTFPRLPGPSEDRHVVRGRPALNSHLFRNRAARESVLVESHDVCPDLRRVGRHRLRPYGQPVHGSSANSLTEQ